MKKFLAVMVVVVLVLGSFILLTAFFNKTNEKPVEEMEQAILCLLEYETFAAVRNYYGEPRQYMNSELLSLQKISQYPDCFEVVVQVETFYGPHNPPYGIETITFHFQYDEVKLINFQHTDD